MKVRKKERKIDRSMGRRLTELERRAYIIGHIICGESTKELAADHNRPEEFVACVLEAALEDYQDMVEYLEKRLQERRKRSGRAQ